MIFRWLSAAVGVPLFIAVCVWGRIPFAVGVTILSAIALWELVRAYQAQGIYPNPLVALLGLLSSAWPLLPFSPTSLPLFGFCVVYIALLWEVFQAACRGELHTGRNLAYGLFCGTYIAFFGGLVWLREDNRPLANGLLPLLEAGAASVLLVTFCVWTMDTLAFYVGRTFGKCKLAPNLSPFKTMEGAVGGLVGALLTGAFFGQIFWSAPLSGLSVGVIVGVLGQVGDLFESGLKREVGIKDFGGILPGHGGILDRFDSLIFTASFFAVWQGWLHSPF
jgi:phosphatidate cytidylyltransferase